MELKNALTLLNYSGVMISDLSHLVAHSSVLYCTVLYCTVSNLFM
jgi:hypothetical protein